MAFHRGPDIVTDGLVSYYDAANPRSYPGSGTVLEDLVDNKEGSLKNGVGYNNNNKGSLVFDGANDYVSTNNFSLDFNTQSFTLSAWVKTSNNVRSGKIINKGQSSAFPAGGAGYSLRFVPTSGAMFSVGDGSSFTSVSVSNVDDVPNNVWKFFVGVFDRATSTQTIYIDGVFNNSATFSLGSTSNPQAELTIGNLERGIYGQGSEFFIGDISTVSIYNKALTADEVKQNYNALKSRFK